MQLYSLPFKVELDDVFPLAVLLVEVAAFLTCYSIWSFFSILYANQSVMELRLVDRLWSSPAAIDFTCDEHGLWWSRQNALLSIWAISFFVDYRHTATSTRFGVVGSLSPWPKALLYFHSFWRLQLKFYFSAPRRVFFSTFDFSSIVFSTTIHWCWWPPSLIKPTHGSQ